MGVSSISSNIINMSQSLSTLQDADLIEAKMKQESLDTQQTVSLSIFKNAMEAPKAILKLIGGNLDTYA